MNNRNHQKQEKHFIVDILFVLALFGVFAVSALALVTIVGDVYQHTVEDMGVNYESRTAVSYIMEKVRQNDTADSIFLTDLENVPALCMLSEIDEETYCTYLYLYDGHLKELFMREGASLGGQVLPAGTDIMDLQEFSLSYASDDLIRISLRTASGEDLSLIHIYRHIPHVSVDEQYFFAQLCVTDGDVDTVQSLAFILIRTGDGIDRTTFSFSREQQVCPDGAAVRSRFYRTFRPVYRSDGQ